MPALEAALRPGDIAIFTADHGCDPTAPGTDHTREYAPYVEIGERRGLGGTLSGFDQIAGRVSAKLLTGIPVSG